MKKRKMRRFAEGGFSEDEDKAEGLRRSAGEKVGFLQRLRMGNIDDPESEAYSRFGAGRGRADRAAAAAAPAAVTPAAVEPVARPPVAPVARPPVASPTAAPDYTYGEDERPAPTGMGGIAELRKSEAIRPAARPPAGAPVVKPSARRTPGDIAAMREAMPASSARRAEIPVDTSLKAPAAEGRMMGETERNIRNILGATAPGLMRGAASATAPLATAAVRGAQAGRGEAAMAREIGRAAESAPVSAARTPAARTAESGMRYTPKQEMQAAESTVRGATSRKGVQAARAAREKGRAEAMEEAKPALQASKKKPSPRSRTRDEEDVEFRKGGKIKGYASGGRVRGDGICQRGHTKGTMR